MAYVSVSEWRPEQVTEWLKGLDVCVAPYLHWFSNNEVNGQQLLNLSPDELTHLGVHKIGHQEVILDAVEHLRNFHYELDRENLQLLALKVSCAAHSLYNEIKYKAETTSVPTQTMADVSNVINQVKPLVSWLDRPPFSGQIEYTDYKTQLLRISLEMAICAQRDTFAERPISEIRNCSSKLAKLADSIVQDVKDPMLLQPASLDLATIKKRVGEDLGFYLIPSFHGIHQISDMKLCSPAYQSGKIQPGDEVVQVNYQTVVGWSRKKVLALFDESPNDLLLTLKRRPRHVKMYGQIYMKPYRLPSRKRSSPYSRWNDTVSSPRPELLTLPPLEIPRVLTSSQKGKKNEDILSEPSGTSSSSDEEFGPANASDNSISHRLYLPKPRAPIQRRFTLSGPPRPSAQSEQFWRELQLERSWRSNQNNSRMNNSNSEKLNKEEEDVDNMFQLRDKSASLGNSIAGTPNRPAGCLGFQKVKIGCVKFNLCKSEKSSDNLDPDDIIITEERDKTGNDNDPNSSSPGRAVEKPCEGGAELASDKGGAELASDNDNPNTLNKMTISELNKMKRDAFFNNMECFSVGASKFPNEDSSEKVKRIIENFKTEMSCIKMEMSESDIVPTPGKVSQLIGSFERKEMHLISKVNADKSDTSQALRSKEKTGLEEGPKRRQDSGDDSGKVLDSNRGKQNVQKQEETDGKSDKAPKVPNNQKEDQPKPSDTESTDLNQSSSTCDADKNAERSLDKAEKETHGQMVNTINDYLLPDRDFYGTAEAIDFKSKGCSRFDEDDEASNGSDFEYRTREGAGEIVDTVNLALVELKQRQDHYDLRDKQKEEEGVLRNEFLKEVSSASSTLTADRPPECVRSLKPDTELKKPIPTERKSKMNPEKQGDNGKNVYIGPLPPKPRPRMVEKVPEIPQGAKSVVKGRTPPEPPPRPESTFSKVVHPRNNDARDHANNPPPVSEIRKGNLSISSPLNLRPTTPVSLPTSSAEVGSKNLEIKSTPPPSVTPRESFKYPQSVHGPSTPLLSVVTEKPKSSGSTLENLKAILNIGRKPLIFNSPRSVRKKNAMLARRRNVSVKDVSPCDHSGILWHRIRKGTAADPWSQFYFVLQGSNFYGFKSKDSQKADLFIHLPGFTCTVADEVKSKGSAFKIYHTGTVFYFAANSDEDLQQWLDSVSLATICPDEKNVPETVTFSVSDSDSDPELEQEACFPTSPKMKKFLGSSPVPKPARSHQNLASDSKKTYDIQKRFGSLKKLSSHKHSSNSQNLAGGSDSGNANNSEIASLDRKYLRFLGQRNTPLPVPTSQFRSYRRMQPAITAAVPPNVGEKSEGAGRNPQQSNKDQPGLMRKALHLSNPSLIHPDMADYRVTQERMAEARRLRNQENIHESFGFRTLEQFTASRQAEEALMRSNRARGPELRGFMTLEQFLLRQEEERQLSHPENRARDNQGIPYMREPSASSSADNSSRSRQSNFERALENALAKHKTCGTGLKHSLKFKCLRKNESPPSTSSHTCQSVGERSSASSQPSAKSGKAKKKNTVTLPPEEDDDDDDDDYDDYEDGIPVSSLEKEPEVDYPNLKYPPVFVPHLIKGGKIVVGDEVYKYIDEEQLNEKKRENK